MNSKPRNEYYNRILYNERLKSKQKMIQKSVSIQGLRGFIL